MKLSITYLILLLPIFGLGQSLIQPDTLSFVPEKIKDKISGPIDYVLSIDLNGDGLQDYIVKQGFRNKLKPVYFEFWLDHEYKQILKREKHSGGIEYEFYINLDSDQELELITAYGYEDGIDYSIIKINYEKGKEEVLFYFNPVIIINDAISWGYPWDITDIYSLKRMGGAYGSIVQLTMILLGMGISQFQKNRQYFL